MYKPASRRFLSSILLLGITGYSVPGLTVDYWQKQEIQDLLKQTSAIEGIPSISLTIVEQGSIAWSTSLGFSNLETRSDATPQTLYRSGSLVKPLTATAALQLASRNLLDLDAPVSEYCTEFPEKKWPVTTRQLLSHTGGIRSYKMPWTEFEKELYSTRHYASITDALAIFKEDPLKSEPGTKYQYSSYGYNLIGCVIEAISGTSYTNYLQKNILGPAGMTDTLTDIPSQIISDRAAGYRRNNKGKLLNERYVDLSNKIPSGGLLTTTVDMARFSISYMNGHLIPMDYVSDAMKPVQLKDSSMIEYGYGWQVSPRKQQMQGTRSSSATKVFHGGVTPGISAIMALYPEQKGAIVIMMNLYNVDGREKLVHSIKQILTKQTGISSMASAEE